MTDAEREAEFAVIEAADGSLHVVPKSPRRKHLTTLECWCGPRQEDGVVIHEVIQ